MAPAALFLQPADPDPAAGYHLVVAGAECADPAREEACRRWIREVRIPADLARPGWRRAWSLRSAAAPVRLDPAAGDWGPHVTLYEVVGRALAGALAARAEPRWPAGAAGGPPGVHEREAVAYRALGDVRTPANTPPAPYAHRATPGPAVLDREEPLRRFVVLVESDCPEPRHLDAVNRWYDEIHIPDVLASPGYRSAWRFELVAPTAGRGRFLTFYEVHAADIVRALQVRDARREAERKLGAYEGSRGLAPLSLAPYEAL